MLNTNHWQSFDVIIDDDTFETNNIVIKKKSRLAEQIKSSENIEPLDFIKTI